MPLPTGNLQGDSWQLARSQSQLTAIASKQEDLKKDKDKLATLDRQIQSLTEDAKHQCADIKAREQNLLQDKDRLQHERERLISRSHQLNET